MQRTTPSILAALSLGLLIASCSSDQLVTSGGSESSSSSQSSQAPQESASPTVSTHNVSYVGTVNDLGISIYQQGTHTLVLSDGQFILLESTDANLNLNAYLGKRVEMRGSVQPTVEGNASIMRVEQVTVLDTSSSGVATASGGATALSRASGGATAVTTAGDGAISSSIMSVAPSSAMTSSKERPAISSAVSSDRASSAAGSLSSSSPSSNSAALAAQIVLMAKQTYNQDNLWTQKYCTSHIAFCIPVHKNWYFKSFGATTTNMWHVEFSMASINALYQGPIILNLVPGSSASVNATDGQVRAQGSDVVGFKDWNDGTHFEIIADARLHSAVAYMLSHITPYTPE